KPAGEEARTVAHVEGFEADAVEAASIQRARASAGVDELALAAFAVAHAVSAVAEEFGSIDQRERGSEAAFAGNENRSAPGGKRVDGRLDGRAVVGCSVAFGAVIAHIEPGLGLRGSLRSIEDELLPALRLCAPIPDLNPVGIGKGVSASVVGRDDDRAGRASVGDGGLDRGAAAEGIAGEADAVDDFEIA